MKENSAHGFTEGSEVPEEQDAAHSLDKGTNSDRYIPTKQTDPDKVAASLRGKLRDANRELTRLRSELQQRNEYVEMLTCELQDTKDYYEKAQQHLIDEHFSELQQERELRKELVERKT